MKSYWKIGSSKGKRPIWILLLWQRLGGFFDGACDATVGGMKQWSCWSVFGICKSCSNAVLQRFDSSFLSTALLV